MTKCSDCGRDIESTTLEGVCAERSGHEARCTCERVYHGSGLFFPLPPGAVPGMFAGYARSADCPLHNEATPPGSETG